MDLMKIISTISSICLMISGFGLAYIVMQYKSEDYHDITFKTILILACILYIIFGIDLLFI